MVIDLLEARLLFVKVRTVSNSWKVISGVPEIILNTWRIPIEILWIWKNMSDHQNDSKTNHADLVQNGECNMCTDSNKNVYCALCTYQSHKYDISEIVNDDSFLVHNCLAVDKSKLCKL